MKHIFSATTERLCGHADLFSFHSGTQARRDDRLYAAATVCGSCRIEIQSTVAPETKGFFKLSLPALSGYPKDVSWANGIRIEKLRALGPVMAKLSKSDDAFAAVSLGIYQMLFQVSLAKFWVTNRANSFGQAWMVSEIEALMRKRESSACRIGQDSAFGYWSTVSLEPINAARALLPQNATALTATVAPEPVSELSLPA